MATKLIRVIQGEISDKENQIRKLEVELAALRSVLSKTTGEPDPSVKLRAPRSQNKELVLSMLEEVGKSGLNAALIVEMAEKRKQTVERGSISSLLSRLKNDGVLTYDGQKYRLKDSTPSNSERVSATIVPITASKAAP